MKLSKFALPAIAALALAACGNLSKVSKEGTTDNPVWPDAAKTTLRHDNFMFFSFYIKSIRDRDAFKSSPLGLTIGSRRFHPS